MADFTIRLDIRVSPSVFRWALTGMLISSLAGELASENVQLTTYYPAPSGVYTQMVTTQNTYLARDSGYVDVGTTAPLGAGNGMSIMNGNVGIGTTAPTKILDVRLTGGTIGDEVVWGNITNGVLGVLGTNTNYTYWAPTTGSAVANQLIVANTGRVAVGTASPQSKFDVAGSVSIGAYGGVNAAPANGLIVSGNVGIGVAAPGNKLQVFGSGAANIDFAVNGRMQTGDGSGDGGVWLDNADNLFIGQNGTEMMLWTSGAGAAVSVVQAGRVGFGAGNTNPYSAVDVGGDGVVLSRQACAPIAFTSGCGGYVTMVAGMYGEVSAAGTAPPTYSGDAGGATNAIGGQLVNVGQGTMLCCGFPAGGAYW